MKRVLMFGLPCFLLLGIAAWALLGESKEAGRTPHRVVIVAEGIHSREGIAQTSAISIVDRKTIDQLAGLFPDYDQQPSSPRSGGWETSHQIYFHFAKGRVVCVRVSENDGGQTWTTGDGDFKTRGNFAEAIGRLKTVEIESN